MSTLPYVGSKISLISNAQIRYEGTLYTISPEESTIALQNVKSFGTEGRKTPEIPWSNEVYDFIVFRGKDIRDLTVLSSADTHSPATADPAIVSVSTAPPGKGRAQESNAFSSFVARVGSGAAPKPAPAPAPAPVQASPPAYGYAPAYMPAYGYDHGYGYGAGRGYANRGGYAPAARPKGQQKGGKSAPKGQPKGQAKGQQQQQKGGQGNQKAQPKAKAKQQSKPSNRYAVGELVPVELTKETMKPDFDFASANEGFNKEKEKNDYSVGYDKTSSFFDTISSDQTRKKEPRDPETSKSDREKQRMVDVDTFGQAAMKRPFGRRMNRGRGGRQ